MKHTLSIFVFCVAICCCNKVQAQFYHFITQPVQSPSFDTFVNTPGVTLGQVLDTLRALANPNDTVEGELAHQTQFWQGRAGSNDGSGHNMFKQYYAALRAEILAGRGACGTSGYQGAWEVIGPDNMPTQTVGRVDAVWADPDDSNYILAGAENIKNSLNLLVLC